MRKKQLLKNINDLIEKNSELYNDNCLLSDKIKQNLDEINSLISENKRLNSLIEELQKELDEVKCSKLVFNEDCSFNNDDASFFEEFDREESIQNITGTTILVSDNIDTVLPVNDDKILLDFIRK